MSRLWQAIKWLYRRDVHWLRWAPGYFDCDARAYKVGPYTVGVSGQQIMERAPLQTPEQVAWQNVLDGRGALQ